jgi:hypothetical protein
MCDSVAQKLEKILPPDALKEGFSEQRIEALRQAQQVYCLPELFRQLLLMMGENVLGRLIFPDGPFEALDTLKGQMIDQLESAEVSYPDDIFFFHGNHAYDVYLFFRTRDCEDDPPVYSVGPRCFFRIADTLSEFILGILESSPEKRQENQEKASRRDFYYDPKKDAFYDLSIPAETSSRVEKAKEIILDRYGQRLSGCTEAEIESLKQAQHTACLPEVYRQVLLFMGKSGIEWVVYGRTTYEFLKQAREEFIAAAAHNPAVSYPQDIFVFLMDHRKCRFGFFRTKDGADDPVVYGYEGQFYKLADTLSEFILQELDSNSYRSEERGKQRRQVTYCYDASQDQFVVIPHPE